MSEKNNQAYQCKGCGNVKELDKGFAESRIPSPEESMDQWSARQAQVPPQVEENAKPTEETPQDVLGAMGEIDHMLGHCVECGGSNWLRMGDMTMNLPPIVEEPEKEKQPVEAEPVDPVNEPQAPITIGEHEDSSASSRIIGEMSIDLPPIPETDVEKPKVKHKCEGCGEVKEFEPDPEEMPTCALCGAQDWEKEHA